MSTFAELVASRKDWIESVLKPWCVSAPLIQLRLAEQEWGDIAGRVDANATLWAWAWSRFPDLVHEDLPGVNETYEARITLRDGSTIAGYPDNRQTVSGRLVLLCRADADPDRFEESRPISIDEIASVERLG
jgi:hypothetical protein